MSFFLPYGYFSPGYFPGTNSGPTPIAFQTHSVRDWSDMARSGENDKVEPIALYIKGFCRGISPSQEIQISFTSQQWLDWNNYLDIAGFKSLRDNPNHLFRDRDRDI